MLVLGYPIYYMIVVGGIYFSKNFFGSQIVENYQRQEINNYQTKSRHIITMGFAHERPITTGLFRNARTGGCGHGVGGLSLVSCLLYDLCFVQ